MGTFLRLVIIALVALLAINIAWWLFKAALALVIPAVVLGALAYIIYTMMGGRLPGGSDKTLPR